MSVDKKVFDIRARTFLFSVRIIKLVDKLPRSISSRAIASQIVRSGTSVGANVEEAQNSSSKKEFIRGLTIALKESRETEYWLKLIAGVGLVPKGRLKSLLEENKELIRILTTIVKNAKKN
ncbi:MAG: hypothetical protein UV74_C0001G0073 [Candidatus Woesebacteria bacterium GW2011_GWB1_43_14]|uniref:Four helix bundle protein n=1 Tax=Candidatus Woesebacteria bacterium GW2011_GWB1_43_14 TaxID=1618578 RepID=A0A0G1GJK9_9BACT|nr:MAG: hypothetical protein UV51_C0002G0062 [Candidatus Woesebacteria bacterium GW2011_GWC1_42_9]KKS98963.1 MAG: hypothetical protein UV74_C0001G0073 [Candidatus Woesebacteria bacterium GW2011_GWB1_43_14]